MKKQEPQATIIICAHNEEKYIGDCLKSVINQTYKNIEILVIEDGSTDNTLNEIKKNNDTRIKVLKNKKNKGITYGRNLGLKKASGEFIFFTDADCVADKKWIKGSMDIFLEHPEVGIIEGKILAITL